MEDSQLNSQYFAKHRKLLPVPPNDMLTAYSGKWVASQRQPEYYYNGWYPIRKCSYPGHQPKVAAGLPSEKKITGFRNCRVICDICDHGGGSAKDPSSNYQWCCPRNINAPIVKEKNETEAAVKKNCQPDVYWRYHDLHLFKPDNVIDAHCKVHHKNWFSRRIVIYGRATLKGLLPFVVQFADHCVKLHYELKEELELINQIYFKKKMTSRRERYEALKRQKEQREMTKSNSKEPLGAAKKQPTPKPSQRSSPALMTGSRPSGQESLTSPAAAVSLITGIQT